MMVETGKIEVLSDADFRTLSQLAHRIAAALRPGYVCQPEPLGGGAFGNAVCRIARYQEDDTAGKVVANASSLLVSLNDFETRGSNYTRAQRYAILARLESGLFGEDIEGGV